MAEQRRDEVGPRDAGRWSQNLPGWAQGAATRAQRFDPNDLTTVQVLGIAVGAATAVGGLAVALQPEPEPKLPPPVERAVDVLPKGQQKAARRAAVQTARGADETGARVEQVRQNVAVTATRAAERVGEAALAARENVGSAIAALGATAAAGGAAIATGEAGGKARKAAEQERERAGKAGRGRRRIWRVRAGLAQAGDSAFARRMKGEQGTMSALQERIEETMTQGRMITRRGKKDLLKQLEQLRKQTDKLQKQVARQTQSARKQLPGQHGPLERMRRQLPGQHGPLDTARDTAADISGNVGKALAAVGAATAAAATPLIEKARSGELTEEMRGRTADITGRVREDLLPQVLGTASEAAHRVREDYVPQVVSTASDVAQRVREEYVPQVVGVAGDVAQRVREEYAPQAADIAAKTGARAAALAGTGVAAGRAALQNIGRSDASDLAEQARKTTRRTATRAGKVTQRGGEQVTSALGRGASAVGNATKETALTLFWGAALGGIVYYAFLNEEQRQKVVSTARSIVEQARELIRDFQGYDEEF